MAGRLFRNNQFYSQCGFPVYAPSKISLVAPVAALKVTQGLTLTAVALNASGNAITIAFTPGAVAGSEVVTVVGNAISVQIATGVSTVTQVRTAMQAAAPCTALVTTTGTSAATVATAAAVSLTGGVESVSAFNGKDLIASVLRSGVGQYTITLKDSYNSERSIDFQFLAATPVNLMPQVLSIDVVTAKTIVVSLLAGATPTEVAAAATLYMDLVVNNSSIGN